jgi:DNA-binding transcriptional regulator YdaS (Cro superfamily)
MTITEVLDHYGGVAPLAKALGISYQAVNQWVEKGQVPEGRQWQIQSMTDGALTVEGQDTAA